MLYINTQKKKTHIIIKSAHSSLHFTLICEKGGICVNYMNTSKLNLLQNMPIYTTGICFNFLRLITFNNKKVLRSFYRKSLFYARRFL